MDAEIPEPGDIEDVETEPTQRAGVLLRILPETES